MAITDLLQVCSNKLISSGRNKLLRACCHQAVNKLDDNKLVTPRRHQTCWDKLVASLQSSSTLLEADNNLSTTGRNNWEQAVRTHLETA